MITPKWAKRYRWGKLMDSPVIHALKGPIMNAKAEPICNVTLDPKMELWSDHPYLKPLACKRCEAIAKKTKETAP